MGPNVQGRRPRSTRRPPKHARTTKLRLLACGMSPCMADTVKLLLRIFSVSQSTCGAAGEKHRQLGPLTVAADALLRSPPGAVYGEPVPPTPAPHPASTHLALGVAEDDGLRDGQRVVQVAQRVKLPLLALHRHKELLDALQGARVGGWGESGAGVPGERRGGRGVAYEERGAGGSRPAVRSRPCGAWGRCLSCGSSRAGHATAAGAATAAAAAAAEPASDSSGSHAAASKQPRATRLQRQLIALDQDAHGVRHELPVAGSGGADGEAKKGGKRGWESGQAGKPAAGSEERAQPTRQRSRLPFNKVDTFSPCASSPAPRAAAWRTPAPPAGGAGQVGRGRTRSTSACSPKRRRHR